MLPLLTIYFTSQILSTLCNQKISNPQIVHSPKDTYQIEGNLEFKCVADGQPQPKVTWYDSETKKPISNSAANLNEQFEMSTGIHINQYLGQLTISDPKPKTVYAIYCNVSNSAGWAVSNVVRGGLTYIDSTFKRISENKLIQKGDRIVLECQPPNGFPVPTIEWLFNGITLQTTQFEGISKSSDGNLYISEVNEKNVGTYTCEAENLAGRKFSPPIHVTMQKKPKFIKSPNNVIAKQGESVKFACQVNEGQIIWSRGPSEPPISTNRAQYTSEYLTLHNIQPSDSGTYICVALDGSFKKATLKVETKPSFTIIPVDQTVNEGESVLLNCRTSGFPKSNIYWELPNHTPIFYEDSVENMYVHANGDLEIKNIKMNDSGTYQCAAHFSQGSIHTSAQLHVVTNQNVNSINDKIDVYRIPPIISLPPNNQTMYVGESVLLDCEVGITRNPYEVNIGAASNLIHQRFKNSEWVILWLRGSRSTGGLQEQLDFTHSSYDRRFQLLPGGGLQISQAQVEDTGNYTCVVQTNFSPTKLLLQVNWTASLIVLPQGLYSGFREVILPPPSPPGNIQAINITSYSVTLTWEATETLVDRYKKSISYRIEMFEVSQSSDSWQILEDSWSLLSIRVQPLQSHGIYYFLIRPRWTDGRFGWASAPIGPIRMKSSHNVLQLVTQQYISDEQTNIEVNNLEVNVLTSRQARFKWSFHTQNLISRHIEEFAVRYKEVPLIKCTSKPSPAFGSSNYCSLTNSYKNENLTSRIEKFQKQLHTFTLLDAQGISIVPQDYPQFTKKVPVNKMRFDMQTIIIDDLKPFRCYDFEVYPFKTNLSSDQTNQKKKSNSIFFLTFEDYPSNPPIIRNLKRKTNHSVQVSWSPPPGDSWNGLLIEYIIFIYNAAQNDKRELIFPFGELLGTVDGLKTGELYHIQMVAVNCKGRSVRSIPLNFLVNEVGVINGTSSRISSHKTLESDFIQQKSNTNTFLLQPWIVWVIPSVIIIWFLCVIFIVWMCWRQKNVTKQLFPTSGTFDTDNGTAICKNPTSVGDFKSKFKQKHEIYHLEPLIKPQSTSGSSEIEVISGNIHSQQNNGTDVLKTPSQHNSDYQQSPMPKKFPSTTLASSNSSSAGPVCGHQLMFDEVGNPMLCSEFSEHYYNHVTNGPVPILNQKEFFESRKYPNPADTSAFSNGVLEHEVMFTNGSTVTGLPLVAPVAQLASPEIHLNVSKANLTATPYATASLINNECTGACQPKLFPDHQGSQSPSDLASGSSLATDGFGTMQMGKWFGPNVNCNSRRQFNPNVQQYQSHSSSGTTTGEEDYLAHNRQKPRLYRQALVMQQQILSENSPTEKFSSPSLSYSSNTGGNFITNQASVFYPQTQSPPTEYDQCLSSPSPILKHNSVFPAAAWKT